MRLKSLQQRSRQQLQNITRLPQTVRQQWRDRLIRWLWPGLQPLVEAEIETRLSQAQDLDRRQLQPLVQEIINQQIRIWGEADRLKIAPTAQLVNTLLNTSSGNIEIGEYTFTGHNVSILTGSHNYETLMAERLAEFPKFGRDITIGKGVWIGSNAMILGPCEIGDHAVVAAGAVVVAGSQIPAGAIVAGIPAKVIKQIDLAAIRSAD
jgi:acetyltransferase-like isoleucine patch superfamily enzyme